MDTVALIVSKLQTLSPAHQASVLDFVEFLLSKYPASPKGKSAEARAIERMKDIDDPSMWITVIGVDDPIDIESTLEELRKSGYPVKVPSQTP